MRKHGYIYLMRLEENLDPWKCAHKIGRSISPEDRARQIGLVLPYDMTLVHEFWVSDAIEYERYMHERLRPWHLQGEWFWPDRDWINWFRSLSQYYIDTGEYPEHEPFVHGRQIDRSYR